MVSTATQFAFAKIKYEYENECKGKLASHCRNWLKEGKVKSGNSNCTHRPSIFACVIYNLLIIALVYIKIECENEQVKENVLNA